MLLNNEIAILYLSIGSGHQIAAEALANAVHQENPNIKVIAEDLFADTIDILPSALNILQAVSLTIAPGAYDLAWRRKATYDTYQWITDTKLLQNFLIEKFDNQNPDVIITTHVLPCILAVGLKKRSFVRKVFGVVTDFGAHSLWPTEGVDGYFVASNELKNTMIYHGIAPQTIHITGIPIKEVPRVAYVRPTSNILKLLLIGGGLRGGGYMVLRSYFSELLEALVRHDVNNIDLTIVTGHQKQLRKNVASFQEKSRYKIKVLGVVNDMPKLMMSNDILIAKPGGLILAEALARGMCIIVSQPGAGQEGVNAEFLARHGLAFNGEDPTEAAKLIKYLTENPEIVDEMKSRAKRVGQPDSSRVIAKIILSAQFS